MPVSAFFWVERTGVAPDRPKTVWGTDQKVWAEFEREVRKAGNARVGIVRISGRTHLSILEHLKDEDDPASNNIIAFVNGTSRAK